MDEIIDDAEKYHILITAHIGSMEKWLIDKSVMFGVKIIRINQSIKYNNKANWIPLTLCSRRLKILLYEWPGFVIRTVGGASKEIILANLDYDEWRLKGYPGVESRTQVGRNFSQHIRSSLFVLTFAGWATEKFVQQICSAVLLFMEC